MNLPRILIIDDQIAGRADLRHRYCKQWGVLDADYDKTAVAGEPDVGGSVAVASFCSGQQAAGGAVRNSLEVAERAVEAGWPSPAGWRWALVLLDVRFDSTPSSPEDDTFGLGILERLVSRWPEAGARRGNTELPVVMLSTIDRAERATDAGRGGAREYVEKKTLDRDRMAALLLEHGLLEDLEARGRSAEQILLGRSLPFLRALREARRIARMRNGNAMILGAAGTGKSSLAHYIHVHSGRTGPYIPYFPTSSAEELEYAGLFGCWKGAHSTAAESYAGKAEQAHQGTLLVDEVHHIGSRNQVELLEFGRPVAGERWVTRLGKTMPKSPPDAVAQAKKSILGRLDPTTCRIAVEVLLLSASNEILDDPAWRRQAGFSEALYTRLAEEYAGGPLHLPSLAECSEDVPLLFAAAVERATAAIGGRPKKAIDPTVLAELRAHTWPGNVAELMGLARKVAQAAKDFEDVFLHHLPALGSTAMPTPPTPKAVPAPYDIGTPDVPATPAAPPAEQIAATIAVAAGSAPTPDGNEGALTLANLADRLRRIRIDKDDPALDGVKEKIDAAFRQLLQRCAGAALARWRKPDGKIDRIAAIRMITGDATLDKSEIPREIKRILGLPLTPTKVTDEEIQQLLDAWGESARAEKEDGRPAEREAPRDDPELARGR